MSFALGAFPYDPAFVVACQPNSTNWCSSGTEADVVLNAPGGDREACSFALLQHVRRTLSPLLFFGEQEQPRTYTSTLMMPAFHGMSTARTAPEKHALDLYSDSFERTDRAQ